MVNHTDFFEEKFEMTLFSNYNVFLVIAEQ